MDVKLTSGSEIFDLPEWPRLLAANPHAHVFSTPQWTRLWWEEFGRAKELLGLTFMDPHPVGLAVLMIDDDAPGGSLVFPGGDDLTDYRGPLAASPEHLPEIAEALVAYILEEIPGWSRFEAHGLAVPHGLADLLVEAADRLGCSFSIEQQDVSAILPLPTSYEEYLDGLGSRRRHELQRKLRRFDQLAAGFHLAEANRRSLSADLGDFIALHRSSQGDKGGFMGQRRAGFFRRIASEFAASGQLRLDFLEVGDDRVASTFSFAFANAFYLYNSAFDRR